MRTKEEIEERIRIYEESKDMLLKLGNPKEAMKRLDNILLLEWVLEGGTNEGN